MTLQIKCKKSLLTHIECIARSLNRTAQDLFEEAIQAVHPLLPLNPPMAVQTGFSKPSPNDEVLIWEFDDTNVSGQLKGIEFIINGYYGPQPAQQNRLPVPTSRSISYALI